MRSRQIMGIRILMLFALIAAASNVVFARSTVTLSGLLLTPQEEAIRLRSLASPEVARRLHPSGVGAVSTIRPMPFYQRNYQAKWLDGPLDERINRRRILAEKIGEQGRARFAAEHGLTKLLGSRGHRSIHQGPDSVYWNSRTGRLVVLEAKGGTSPIRKHFRGLPQNTNQYTLQSARNVLARYRRSASPEMKVQMARVIWAAEKGHLDTGVIRTGYVLGKPDPPKLVAGDRTNVAREARRVRQGIIKTNPEAREYFREARRNHWQDRMAFRAGHRTFGLKHGAAQGMRVIGFAGALGLGWDSYQQFRTAWSMIHDSTLNGSVLPYMQTGVAVGRMAQATTLGVGSTGPLGILKLSARRGIGTVAGRAVLPVTLGVEGLQLVMAYHEYGLGRISQREFYRRSAGPAIMAVFTVGGATVGGIVGLQVGGVTAIPGAMTGAKVGAFASIPVQFAFDYGVGWYYREFDEKQRRVVNAAVETFYGLEPRGQVVQH